MIICTMTSWKKRINVCLKSILSVLKNTIKPDVFYLNLSIEEFPKKDVELPQEILELKTSFPYFKINWVDGPNTKSMKKIFPILKYAADDDFILSFDDDIIYPTDIISQRLIEYNKYQMPITPANNPRWHFKKRISSWIMQSSAIIKKKMLNNWQELTTKTLIESYNDDELHTLIMFANGYKLHVADKYMTRAGISNEQKLLPFNPDDDFAMGKNNVYKSLIEDDFYWHEWCTNFKHKFKKDFTFGALQKEKHDAVLVYNSIGIDSKELHIGRHLELEYAINSLKKYCKSWLNKIYVVGSKPPKAIESDVIWIPCDNPFTHCKDANIVYKLEYACKNIKNLSNDFLMISDDQIVTENISWEQFFPRYLCNYSDHTEQYWEKNSKINFWHKCLYDTMHLFDLQQVAFWEPHIWSPINKQSFMQMCQVYDYRKSTACITQTLYYNFIKQPKIKQNYVDFKYLGSDNDTKQFLQKIDQLPTFISWTDYAFKNETFRAVLDSIIFDAPKPMPIKKQAEKTATQVDGRAGYYLYF